MKTLYYTEFITSSNFEYEWNITVYIIKNNVPRQIMYFDGITLLNGTYARCETSETIIRKWANENGYKKAHIIEL